MNVCWHKVKRYFLLLALVFGAQADNNDVTRWCDVSNVRLFIRHEVDTAQANVLNVSRLWVYNYYIFCFIYFLFLRLFTGIWVFYFCWAFAKIYSFVFGRIQYAFLCTLHSNFTNFSLPITFHTHFFIFHWLFALSYLRNITDIVCFNVKCAFGGQQRRHLDASHARWPSHLALEPLQTLSMYLS